MNRTGPGNWRIDVHHHVVPPEFADDSMPVRLPASEEQLRSMDSWHIRAAITSLTPRVLLKNLHRLREVARACNEFQARRVGDNQARFGRGKTIGINRFGGSNDAAVLMAVKAWKMDPSDIKMIQTGGTSARMAALLSKKVDATVQSYPEIYQARKLGMNVLADIGDYGLYTNTSNIVTRTYLQQNRAAIKGFIKGQIEGMHYVKTNKEGSLKILRKHLQITDAEAVEGTYEFFAKRLARSPRTEVEGIKNILNSIDAAQRNPADFIDMSIIDEIEKEGFVQKLYGN